MKKYPGIDYNFRPENYWLHETVLQSILRDVKGTQRRKMIKDYYELGLFQELEETLTKTSLTDEERKRMASIHPMFMGGEYLPDYVKDETEIARIELNSTLADVISIRAKTEDEIITYSIVDDYDKSEFELPVNMGVEPFNMEELIRFIDEAGFNGSTGIATCHNNSNAEHMDREDLADFTTVSSCIYNHKVGTALHCCAMPLARARAGSSSEARMAMIAMTTSSSIRVNPRAWLVGPVSLFLILRLAKRVGLIADETIVRLGLVGNLLCRGFPVGAGYVLPVRLGQAGCFLQPHPGRALPVDGDHAAFHRDAVDVRCGGGGLLDVVQAKVINCPVPVPRAVHGEANQCLLNGQINTSMKRRKLTNKNRLTREWNYANLFLAHKVNTLCKTDYVFLKRGFGQGRRKSAPHKGPNAFLLDLASST